jgi:hypothetical protein
MLNCFWREIHEMYKKRFPCNSSGSHLLISNSIVPYESNKIFLSSHMREMITSNPWKIYR